MSNPPNKRCIHCGAKFVRVKKGAGRTIPYRTMPTMELPTDLKIPSCGRCMHLYLDRMDAETLSNALQEQYLASLHTRICIALDTLSQHISQRKLERLLGLSQGYLSRLRAGDGNPSPELVCHLAILCQDPKKRLAEVERFWSLSDDNWLPLHLCESSKGRMRSR